MKNFILTICLNPVLQKTIILKSLHENEVNRSSEYYFDASGKGINLTRVLVQLGENAVHLTQAGGINKRLFLNKVKEDNIKIITVDSKSEIRYCYTILNENKNTTTEIVEEAKEVNSKTEKIIYKKFLKILPKTKAVIISGTKAAGFSDNLYPSIVKKAKEENKFVILDIKGTDLKNSIKYKPDIIKPNFVEFVSTFLNKKDLKENENNKTIINEVKDKMLELKNKYKTDIILTRGRYSTIYTENNKTNEINPEKIIPVNTIGSGDAFTAGFTSIYIKINSIKDAVLKGHETAIKNALCRRPGSIIDY